MEIMTVKGATETVSKAQMNTVTKDFETFLRMLTTQIQNQDPLSPMEADRFASQLASFSMVEQQTLTNQKLDLFLGGVPKAGLPDYAALVGRVAVHDGAFQFSGSEVQLEIENGRSQESATIVILDDQGAMVSEIPVLPGQRKIGWDGLGGDGRVVPPGTYSAKTVSEVDGARIESPVSTAAQVEEVRFNEDTTELLLSDGTIIPETAVLRLR